MSFYSRLTGSTPLAWKNLVSRPRRTLVAVGGVGFAVFLVFMELGFLNALLDSTVLLIDRLQADLFLVSPAKFALVVPERFPRERLWQAKACGVSVHPLYMESAYSVLRRPGARGYPIRVVAASLDDRVIELPDELLVRLGEPWTAIYDEASKPHYGFPRAGGPPEATMELNSRAIRLCGRFRLCTDFATDGTLFMSSENFFRYFSGRIPAAQDRSRWIDIGLLRLPPGASAVQVQQCLQRTLPADVTVLTKPQLRARERMFWIKNTPIGYIFVIGTIIGMVVGTVVCYQVVYAEVDDHIREYATLLAIGYSQKYLVSVILWQSFYLAILGFVPAAVLAAIAYAWLQRGTGLLLRMPVWLLLLVGVLALLMCFASGLIAIRRLRKADPASLF
ncbi:MAG: ABC transporter [Pirellulaceae bacterium]|nr:MAG: ABC transporter [Pirellulaceae bacterium]